MPPVRDCTAPPEAGKPNCGHATAPRPCYLGVGGITFVSQNPTAEYRRLSDSADRRADWKNWGPISPSGAGALSGGRLSRQRRWLEPLPPRDHPRSRAYRWNEGATAGYYNCFSESLPVSVDGRSTQATAWCTSLLVQLKAHRWDRTPTGWSQWNASRADCALRGVVQESRCELDP